MESLERDEATAWFCKHFVSLGWTDKTPGERAAARSGEGEVFQCSGFVVSIRDHWFLVTAGHILVSIENAQRNSQVLTEWCLHDTLHAGSRYLDPIPFDFPSAWRWYIDDEDLGGDIALIHLRQIYRLQLEANGIQAIDERAWQRDLPYQFTALWMLGQPKMLSYDVSVTHRLVSRCLIPLIQIDPPADATEPLRLYARIPKASLADLPEIDGVSGSPIFGYKQCDEGVKYWALAVQSGWRQREGIVFASYLRPLLEYHQHLIDTGQFQTP